MSIKLSSVIAFVLLSAITIGGVSVMGLLQSTEKVSTSGIIVIPLQQEPSFPLIPPSSPPPEPVYDIDLYVDSECSTPISSLEWGRMEPGDISRNLFYLKNSGDVNVVLNLQSDNWTPNDSYDYFSLTWDYDGAEIVPGQIIPIELQLSVDQDCPPLEDFSFDIIIIAA